MEKWRDRLVNGSLCFVIAAGLAISARADDIYWEHEPGTEGGWFETMNWSTCELPTDADNAYIDNSGTASISSGDAVAANLYAGYSVSGTVRQSSGTNTVMGEPILIGDELYPTGGELCLGRQLTSGGTYELSGTGELSALTGYVGYMGTGIFRQTGGTHAIQEWLCLGAWSTGNGTYELSGTGELSAASEQVGLMGEGAFTQSGGTNSVTGALIVGSVPGPMDSYILTGGQLAACSEYIGYEGSGCFAQSGGTNTISGELVLGYKSGSSGVYELGGGDGKLSAGDEYVAYQGKGRFTQEGGTNTVNGTLWIGRESGSNGTYEIFGGSLNVVDLVVGCDGSAALNVSDAAAQITVSNELRFGTKATFIAAPRTRVHMNGSAFRNESTDPTALSGLENTELIFEGGKGVLHTFEVSGRDLGATKEGWNNNFALHRLVLGEAEGAGGLQLVDDIDNQPGWEGAEALYVEFLTLSPGNTINLNGFKLYYKGDASLNGKVDGGDLAIWQQHYDPLGMDENTYEMGDWNFDGRVDGADLSLWQQNYNPFGLGNAKGSTATLTPEPATVVLLALGSLCLIVRRRGH